MDLQNRMGTNVRPQFVESAAGEYIPLLYETVAGADLLGISELVSAEKNSYSLIPVEYDDSF